MKISYNWLKQYVQTSLSAEEMAAILTDTGLEVEGVEKLEAVPGGFAGLVVGEVVKKWKHPDADKLSVTMVDLGEGDPIQIVCGAPNVAEGQKVVVATVGTTLYPTGGEPFKIKKGKIRGEESNGMICAEDEIGLGTDHDGIMVLDPAAKAGTPFADYQGVEDDYCIEIGLTPNRADAFSHYGVARDLAAALQHMEGISNEPNVKLQLPDTSAFKAGNNELPIEVMVENTEACPRYAGLTIEGVKVGPSPEWLQKRLRAIGLKPLNNVVDVTNFVCHELGQPLHAFDYDKIKGGKVVVRTMPTGTPFITLDETERKLDDQDLMICNAEEGMCIAGVFGGIKSGVSENTTRVFLESACFDPVFVRKTARRHGLNTDASFRFERGVDPNITLIGLKRAALLIQEVAGGKIGSPVFDSNPNGTPASPVVLNVARLGRFLGVQIPETKLEGILKSLDIEVTTKDGEEWSLLVPAYRVDVKREADVMEEVLRIYGFNNVPIPSKLNASLSYAPKPDSEKIRHDVADQLSARGFLEMMSNSLSRADYVAHTGEESTVVNILNPLSSDLGILRQDLLFGGLEAVIRNLNHKQNDLRMYEFGKIYRKVENGYEEEEHLGIFLSGMRHPENWNQTREAFRFADLSAAVQVVLKALRIEGLSPESHAGKYFSEGISLSKGKEVVVELGFVKPALLKAFDIKQPVLYADIHWQKLSKYLPKSAIVFREPDKFPAVRRDLSILINKEVSFSQLEKAARRAGQKLLREVGLFDVYEGDKLEAGKKSYALSFTLQDPAKTLTDEQVDQSMKRILESLQKECGAELRS